VPGAWVPPAAGAAGVAAAVEVIEIRQPGDRFPVGLLWPAQAARVATLEVAMPAFRVVAARAWVTPDAWAGFPRRHRRDGAPEAAVVPGSWAQPAAGVAGASARSAVVLESCRSSTSGCFDALDSDAVISQIRGSDWPRAWQSGSRATLSDSM
jgi:hypothetical protein